MSIGNISAAWAAARVENSVALCQINFDFTFKKVLPPNEYRAVGKALSIHRRVDAEDGLAHRTARKLGWLFEQIIPDTPQLLRAYGLRVCEILQQPGINPVGTPADGPFQNFVGADCTSLWAAATSGIAALGVHLLSCMLARAWDSATATAIWVELIRERQDQILFGIGQDNNISETSVAAAKQQFSREELANWDSSARAWLARADQARAKQRDQYLLIAKNVSVPTGTTRKPYPNVVNAWTSAMQCMEMHLDGVSQQICDGAVLYAISAWHLFPDLVHFGSKTQHVRFSDPLFVKSATITLGLNEIATSPGNCGPHWSLSLSHLRYYGASSDVESQEDRSRLDMPRFLVVVLGSVLELWKISPGDRLDTIRWISEFWTYLESTAPFDKTLMPTKLSTSWVYPLAQAAKYVLSVPSDEMDSCEDLLRHGERWGDPFLSEIESRIAPFFGLGNPTILAALKKPSDIDAGVEILRQVAAEMGLREGEALISYTQHRGGNWYYEYSTAIPHNKSPTDGQRGCHARWIQTKKPLGNPKFRQANPAGRFITSELHTDVDISCRVAMIKDHGEQCFLLDEVSPVPLYERITNPMLASSSKSGANNTDLIWEIPPPLFTKEYDTATCNSENGCDCTCLESALRCPGVLSPGSDVPYVGFKRCIRRWLADMEGFDLYVRRDVKRSMENSISKNLDPGQGASTPMENLPSFKNGKFCPARVWDYIGVFASVKGFKVREKTPMPKGLHWDVSHARAAQLMLEESSLRPPESWFKSLELLGVISTIYDGLPNATISLGVVEYPLLESEWTETLEDIRGTGQLLDTMDRPITFACIVMMQTGGTNMSPDDFKKVMAISLDNSIFVAACLLTDPYEIVKGRDVRHIIGNVGYSGVNLMISPPGDLIVNKPKNELRIIRRDAYDFNRDDSFERTSLHLRFTPRRFPLLAASSDTIDQDIFHLESVVQLWDNGQHIADLDMLNIENPDVDRVQLTCHCEHPTVAPTDKDIRSLDSWQEVLKPPRRISVVRAHHNWAARLAAVVLFGQNKKRHSVAILGPGSLCWNCLEEKFQDPEPHFPEILVD